MRTLRLLVLVTAAAQVSCAGTIERAFDARGYAYPFHVDLGVRQPNVSRSFKGHPHWATWPRGENPHAEGHPGCSYDESRRSFVAEAARRVDVSVLRDLARTQCPNASAIAIINPFALTDFPDNSEVGMHLGLHVVCYGEGPVCGFHAPAETINADHRREMNAWFCASDNAGYWTLRNVAAFFVTDNGVAFARWVARYNADEDSARQVQTALINHQWLDPIDSISCCGEVESGTRDCGVHSRAL